MACFDVYKRENKVHWKMVTECLPFLARTFVLHGHTKDIKQLKEVLKRLLVLQGSDEEIGRQFRQVVKDYNDENLEGDNNYWKQAKTKVINWKRRRYNRTDDNDDDNEGRPTPDTNWRRLIYPRRYRSGEITGPMRIPPPYSEKTTMRRIQNQERISAEEESRREAQSRAWIQELEDRRIFMRYNEINQTQRSAMPPTQVPQGTQPNQIYMDQIQHTANWTIGSQLINPEDLETSTPTVYPVLTNQPEQMPNSYVRESDIQTIMVYNRGVTTNQSKELPNQKLENSDNQHIMACNNEAGPRLMVDLKINGRWCTALVDTGANTSVIRTNLLTKQEHKQMAAETIKTMAANGGEVAIRGRIEVDIEFNGKTARHWIGTMDKLHFEGIIGTDLIPKLMAEGVIDLATMRLRHKTDMEGERNLEVYCAEQIVIPGRSQVMFLARADTPWEGEALFEPYENFTTKYGLPTSDELVTIKQDRNVPVNLINFSNEEVIIRPNTRLGTLTVMDSVITDLEQLFAEEEEPDEEEAPDKNS